MQVFVSKDFIDWCSKNAKMHQLIDRVESYLEKVQTMSSEAELGYRRNNGLSCTEIKLNSPECPVRLYVCTESLKKNPPVLKIARIGAKNKKTQTSDVFYANAIVADDSMNWIEYLPDLSQTETKPAVVPTVQADVEPEPVKEKKEKKIRKPKKPKAEKVQPVIIENKPKAKKKKVKEPKVKPFLYGTALLDLWKNVANMRQYEPVTLADLKKICPQLPLMSAAQKFALQIMQSRPQGGLERFIQDESETEPVPAHQPSAADLVAATKAKLAALKQSADEPKTESKPVADTTAEQSSFNVADVVDMIGQNKTAKTRKRKSVSVPVASVAEHVVMAAQPLPESETSPVSDTGVRPDAKHPDDIKPVIENAAVTVPAPQSDAPKNPQVVLNGNDISDEYKAPDTLSADAPQFTNIDELECELQIIEHQMKIEDCKIMIQQAQIAREMLEIKKLQLIRTRNQMMAQH